MNKPAKKEESKLDIPNSQGKKIEAGHGDSIVLSRLQSQSARMPVMRGVSMALSTYCDHDIGVVVDDD